jgi:hypothetical protein
MGSYNLFEKPTVAVGPNKPSVEWVLGFFPTDKTAEHEVDN